MTARPYFNIIPHNSQFNIPDDQKIIIFCASDDELCNIFTASSDSALAKAALAELIERSEFKRAQANLEKALIKLEERIKANEELTQEISNDYAFASAMLGYFIWLVILFYWFVYQPVVKAVHRES